MTAPSCDATSALLRALSMKFVGFGANVELEEIRSRGWASVTFTGARHELVYRIEGSEAEAAAEAFLSNLDTADFRLRGHILADIALVSTERRTGEARFRLEALTVEDG